MKIERNMIKNGYFYFYGSSNPLSQWHKVRFQENNIVYSSAEQYMMYAKALLFNDQEIAKKIITSNNPRDIKAFGRKVKNFDKEVWNANCKRIVYKGNYYKFNQNSALKKYLIETKGLILVEASPYDKIWGIGLSEEDPRAWDSNQWLGTNWLGIVLTRLRDDLIKKEKI
ncbi:NADAR family protein [Clostridium botulinum]|uniref:NADAR family protein n=1 Tax=Clostridium botulinum TaxID=1491 RepID=UPI0024913BD2|nr:NADAR family protein [Clostridium botulinum]BDB03689.1 hypothetical protein CBOS2020_37630 [Clostridium botulinum]